MASALFLHRAGFDVVLFDQFAEPRPLGSGLLIQPSGQTILNELGLLATITQRAAPVTRLFGINTTNGKRALDMRYCHLGRDVVALGIHRASLFDILFGAVRAAGIAVSTGKVVKGIDVTKNAVSPVFVDGRSDDNFDLLVDATGANGPLTDGRVSILPFAAFWTTVDMPQGSLIAAASLDQRYHRASRMAGIMPVGINPATGNQGAALFWSVKPEFAGEMLACGIESWREQFLGIWPEANDFVAQVRSVDDLTLAIYRHRTGNPSPDPRILRVGDAWHCTSPQLGQGANMALMDAFAASKAIEHGEDLASIAQRYRHFRSDHVRIYQYLSYMFTPLYQSDSRLLPVIRDAIIQNFAGLPMIRNLIAAVVSGRLGSSQIS
jgi:salicylate hydroxylase